MILFFCSFFYHSKQVGVPAIAIEMASMSNGGSAMESNPLQMGVPINKVRSSFNHAAAAPPEERTARSRRVQRKTKSIGVAIPVETAMGSGKLLYERPDDHCRVFELSWKLAGGSKALLYSFKD